MMVIFKLNFSVYIKFFFVFQEKTKEEGPKERRPFSREIDLQSNRFDNAQKQSILKKASQLNSRFSVGESKFL